MIKTAAQHIFPFRHIIALLNSSLELGQSCCSHNIDPQLKGSQLYPAALQSALQGKGAEERRLLRCKASEAKLGLITLRVSGLLALWKRQKIVSLDTLKVREGIWER